MGHNMLHWPPDNYNKAPSGALMTSSTRTEQRQFGNNEFASTITIREIEERFGVSTDTIWVPDVENPDGPLIKKVVTN